MSVEARTEWHGGRPTETVLLATRLWPPGRVQTEGLIGDQQERIAEILATTEFQM